MNTSNKNTFENIFTRDLKEIEESEGIGFAIYYAIFLFIIPLVIIYLYGYGSLRYYLPVTDLIANVLAFGIPMFNKIFNHESKNIYTYTSTTIISLLALTGVAWIGITKAIKLNSVKEGVFTAFIMFLVTFLIPIDLIPLSAELYDQYRTDIKRETLIWYDDKVIVGSLVILLLIFIEGIIIQYFI